MCIACAREKRFGTVCHSPVAARVTGTGENGDWLRPSRAVRPPAKHWRGMARWPALATLTVLGKKPHKMDYITGAHTQRCPRSFVIPHSQREWPEGVHERIRRNPGSLFSLFAPVQHSPQKMGTGSGQAINTLTLRGLAGACTHFFHSCHIPPKNSSEPTIVAARACRRRSAGTPH